MKYVLTSLFGLTAVTFANSPKPAHFLELGGGIYEHSEPYYGVLAGLGVEYKETKHFIFVGINEVKFNDIGLNQVDTKIEADVDYSTILLGYRASYELNDKFSIFGEVGYEIFDAGSEKISDALGNPIKVDKDSEHPFVGIGICGNLAENWSVKLTARTLFDAKVKSPTQDAIGNVIVLSEESDYSLFLSISYSF